MAENGQCSFFVPGTPRPKGSIRPIALKSGRVLMKQDAGDNYADWTADVKATAYAAWQATQESGRPPTSEAVGVSTTFRFRRPKSHFGTGRNAGALKASAPTWPIGRPDIDKLERAVLDAMTEVVYRDDSQVVAIDSVKVYHDKPGAMIRITRPASGHWHTAETIPGGRAE